ncbi:MAG: queuosine precursor transporter [Patescibacteria group bacterium]|nr:queuosine precursor transporter [Patescibacteria group bacterium]MDE1944304.1 queuosine precursor transporter [Patescibacteria group bacterium]MDE1945295.1 queuosine precursor transporter [Patescibacteria group bacterium]MDE2057872.1 queuosine precursor transporter [Patescibacteria group bacterium]
MGLNDWLLLAEAVVGAGLVVSVWRLDRERLLGVISIGLILIASVGGKVITVFGHETNAGNVFYACVFLATYFLIERYGARQGFRAIWWGATAVAGFLAMAELSVALAGSGATGSFDAALALVFSRAARVALASLLAYVVSQSVNVRLYLYLKERFAGERLWLRAVLASAVAQALDSAIFFSLAFAGLLPVAHLVDILATGYAVKVAFMALAAPLLYLNNVEHEEEGGVASVLVRYDRLAALRPPVEEVVLK